VSEIGVTVAIPVGPEPHHQRYLQECLESVAAQTEKAGEILLIDDMAKVPEAQVGKWADGPVRTWRAPWRLGVPAAFNCGVSLARYPLVFMLGADDKMFPRCLEQCVAAWLENKRRDAYYWVGVRYSDGREDQFQPCNAAMVTKGFWSRTGGFPPESASGACDAALISILIGKNMGGALVCADHENPLIWYRIHENTDTASRGVYWQGIILATRDYLTREWKEPKWGRVA